MKHESEHTSAPSSRVVGFLHQGLDLRHCQCAGRSRLTLFVARIEIVETALHRQLSCNVGSRRSSSNTTSSSDLICVFHAKFHRILWLQSTFDFLIYSVLSNLLGMLVSLVSCSQGRSSWRTLSDTCHHSQTRGRQSGLLQRTYASLDWQFRVSHFGLFLGFTIVFWYHSMTFWGVNCFVEILVLIKYVHQLNRTPRMVFAHKKWNCFLISFVSR
jgi:hypothetical protein